MPQPTDPAAGSDALTLWYDAPAREWVEALPIGNGRLGGMVHGRTPNESIRLNEDSVWYGGPRDRNNPDAKKHLPEIRRLLAEGRIPEAERLAVDALSGLPEHQRHYEPLGELQLFMRHGGDAEAYRRTLDLTTAITGVTYRAGGVTYTRECFASHPDQAIVLRLTADAPGRIGFRARIRRTVAMGNRGIGDNLGGKVRQLDDRTVSFENDSGEGSVRYVAGLRAVAEGGRVETIGQTIHVRDADSATLIFNAATTFYHADPMATLLTQLDAAAERPYDELRERHVADYRALFGRVTFTLDGENRASVPTNVRLQRVAAGESDPGLSAMYFQFGRYLLIACSRPGTLPATLQGIWNDQIVPPWGSKYTININTEMNYWPAEPLNLSECHEPLFDHLEQMVEPGRRTAQVMYGCRGFCCHHNTDLWDDTAPQDEWIPGTYWPLGAAWLCTHLWERYLFTLDASFLDRAYPLLREASLFLLDYLVEDRKGRLVPSPSVSPENTYILPDGTRGRMCEGASMDCQITDALFAQCIEAARILGRDAELAAQLETARKRLPPPSIGRHGQLMEWPEDFEEAEPGHRHISHLWALHPGDAISVLETPRLAQAARVTLERRLANGGGHTGWSRAWIVNFWARLHDGDKAGENVQALLAKSTLPNLFDNHPPFQIDGNFGGAAGIGEMLLQSHADALHLLPALPTTWSTGRITGLRARGGFEVDIEWREGRLTTATIRATRDRLCRVRAAQPLTLERDITKLRHPGEGVTEFDAVAGHTYVLRTGA